ncbi:hypothetical protein [Sinorhizobium meliloti]|nr:hypothetical protein [Sinorhizobium meliloti]
MALATMEGPEAPARDEAVMAATPRALPVALPAAAVVAGPRWHWEEQPY